MYEIEKLINEFINHKITRSALINEISKTDILKHYSNRSRNLDMTELIKKMILEVLLKEKNNNYLDNKSIEVWISKIKTNRTYLFNDFIYSFIDKNYDDILEFNLCFQNYIYIEKHNKPEDMYKILQKSQYYWYRSFLDLFTFLFTQFIEKKLLWKRSMY